MSNEEINYWLEVFRSNKYAFMSKDGLVIPMYKAFEQLKEYRFVLDEIKEYIANNKETSIIYTGEVWSESVDARDLEEILDKVKE